RGDRAALLFWFLEGRHGSGAPHGRRLRRSAGTVLQGLHRRRGHMVVGVLRAQGLRGSRKWLTRTLAAWRDHRGVRAAIIRAQGAVIAQIVEQFAAVLVTDVRIL